METINQRIKRREKLKREFYSGRSLFGNDWAIFFLLIGGRQAGKSYNITDMFVRQWKQKGRPFYWMRLTRDSAMKLLTNNAEKLIDPDLRRKYKLDLFVKGDGVYDVIKRDKEGKIREMKLMARVLDLSTFYADKGSGFYDKDFLKDPNMYYNICLDEMNRESGEKKSFDILYAFTNQLENIVRNTKQRIRVVCIGNTLEEAGDICCAFNFLPEQFGRYYLRKKRCVIEYIEPTEKYLAMRKGSIADILMPTASTFTNQIKTDTTLITKRRLERPLRIIQFDKETKYTVWDGNIIAIYKNEKVPVTAMRPYIDQTFNVKARDEVILQFDNRGFKFKDLITFKKFQKDLTLLKPRK